MKRRYNFKAFANISGNFQPYLWHHCLWPAPNCSYTAWCNLQKNKWMVVQSAVMTIIIRHFYLDTRL